MLRPPSSLLIVCSFFSLACHSTTPPLAASQLSNVTKQEEQTRPMVSPRTGQLTQDLRGKLVGCMSEPDPAEIAKRKPKWIVVLPPNERMAIARKFEVDSKIPWDEVVVGPFGQVRRAILNDESKVISNDVDDNTWMDFWYGFLHHQASVNEPLGPTDLPNPAKPHRRPHPNYGTNFSRWAGSVRITGVPNQAGDKAEFSAQYKGRASEIWRPNHIRLANAELNCIRGFSFPTTATVSYVQRSCPQCNAEQRQSEITIHGGDLLWAQVPTLLSDGMGNYSARWTGLPMPLNTPHVGVGARPTGDNITWHDRYFSEYRTDTISGEHLVDLMCKGIPGGTLLFCAPTEKDVQATIEIWKGATTTWTRKDE